ncbi:MAG: NAD(P)H-hydrate dehydratase [Beutenbergiaceae bacterium]
MITGYLAEQIRLAEAPLLAAGEPLMRRAARAVADTALGLLPVDSPTVLVLVGGGNNGGDGLFAGAELAGAAQVTVVVAKQNPHPEGLAAAVAAGVEVIDASTMDEGLAALLTRRAAAADVWIDALAGIGVRGALRGTASHLVAMLRVVAAAPLPPTVIAVDIPSGVDADTGAMAGPVLAADITVTFGAAKAGALLPPGADMVGRLQIVPLGIDDQLVGAPAAVLRATDADAAQLWPVPQRNTHKYSRGVVGVYAGSDQYPGAAVLTVGAAVRSGCGMVRYLGSPVPTGLVLAAWPEVVAVPGRAQAWVIGPGVAGERDLERAGEVVAAAIEAHQPVVLDAGALAKVPEPERIAGRPVLLTPHAGELATLLGDRGETVDREQVEAEPVHWAIRAANLTGATVLLKGAVTVVASPGGEVYSQDDGTPWLATAGAGDVLAGIAGTLLAQVPAARASVARVAAMAALVHGRAAVRASSGGPIGASDVVAALPQTIVDLLTAGTLDR